MRATHLEGTGERFEKESGFLAQDRFVGVILARSVLVDLLERDIGESVIVEQPAHTVLVGHSLRRTLNTHAADDTLKEFAMVNRTSGWLFEV